MEVWICSSVHCRVVQWLLTCCDVRMMWLIAPVLEQVLAPVLAQVLEPASRCSRHKWKRRDQYSPECTTPPAAYSCTHQLSRKKLSRRSCQPQPLMRTVQSCCRPHPKHVYF